MKLHFKRKTLTLGYVPECQKLIEVLIENGGLTDFVSSITISQQLNVKRVETRKMVQIIRENNDYFFGTEKYIVANRSGYKISKNCKELKKYKDALEKRTHSAVKQLNELFSVIDRSWNE